MQGQRVLIRDLLYQAIREAVINGSLAPGSRVTEVTLAEQFGMSRTPLREAIARLESDQLMIRQSNGALTIAPLDVDLLSEIFEIQERVEGLVVSTLARMKEKFVVNQLDVILHSEEAVIESADFHTVCNFDLDFREILWESSNRQQAVSILRSFNGLFERFRRLAPLPQNVRARIKSMHSGHQIIRSAIAEGDPVWAEMALKSHVRNAKTFLLGVYKKQHTEA